MAAESSCEAKLFPVLKWFTGKHWPPITGAINVLRGGVYVPQLLLPFPPWLPYLLGLTRRKKDNVGILSPDLRQ